MRCLVEEPNQRAQCFPLAGTPVEAMRLVECAAGRPERRVVKRRLEQARG